MVDALDPDDLERRTIAAHRAYIEALVALERVRHAAACPVCAASVTRDADPTDAYGPAALRKEACRAAFRALLDELGRMPTSLSAALPSRDERACLSGMTAR